MNVGGPRDLYRFPHNKEASDKNIREAAEQPKDEKEACGRKPQSQRRFRRKFSRISHTERRRKRSKSKPNPFTKPTIRSIIDPGSMRKGEEGEATL
jgi:hypothetical protein